MIENQSHMFLGKTIGLLAGLIALPSTLDLSVNNRPQLALPTPSLTIVKPLGVRGDGIHDDTDAIQSAVDSLSRNESLYFPHGRYLVTRPILLKSDIALQGPGTLVLNTTEGRVFKGESIQGVSITGLAFEPFKALNPITKVESPKNSAIFFKDSSDIRIANISVRRFWYYGMQFNDCSNVSISNSEVSETGHPNTRFSLDKDRNTTKDHRNWIGDGIIFFGKASNVFITNNTIINNGRHGIAIFPDQPYQKSNITITNNNCSYNGDIGILCNLATNFTITNNSCNQNGVNGGPFGGQGIQFVGSSQGVITQNQCNGNKEHGIQGGNAEKITIANNRCSNNSWSGIDFDNHARQIVAEGNYCSENQWGFRARKAREVELSTNNLLHNREEGVLLELVEKFSLAHNNLINNNTKNLENRASVTISKSTNGLIRENRIIDNPRPHKRLYAIRIYDSSEIQLVSNQTSMGLENRIDGNLRNPTRLE